MYHHALVGAAFTLVVTTTAPGGLTVDLGGGWQATYLDENVSLFTDQVSIPNDLLVIEKFATFTEVDELTGEPRPARILFQQTGTDAETVSRIAITDETLLNLTGQTWDGFRIGLLGGKASFNPEASSAFSIDPFSDMTFLNDNTEVAFSGGQIESGSAWTPGFDAGALWIDVDLSHDAPASFILKELPTIPMPGPGVLYLLGVAGIGARRRRR